jgi:copper chaperone CopZ
MFRSTVIGGLLVLAGCSLPKSSDTPDLVQTQDQVSEFWSDNKPPAVSGSFSLHVKGMGCPLCATNVKKAIERTPGVAAVNIDLGSGVVKVSAKADAAPTESDLRQAVTNAGFQLDRIEKQ